MPTFHSPHNPNFKLWSSRLSRSISFKRSIYTTEDPREIAALRACQHVTEEIPKPQSAKPRKSQPAATGKRNKTKPRAFQPAAVVEQGKRDVAFPEGKTVFPLKKQSDTSN